MARDSTESRFLQVLDRFGGPQHVQLVGELWDRAESRALLETFLRELFQAELPLGADIPKDKSAQRHSGDEDVSRCKGSAEPGDQDVSRCKESAEPGDEDVSRCKESADPADEDVSRCTGRAEPGDQSVYRCKGSVEPADQDLSRCKGSADHGPEEHDSQTAVMTSPAPQPTPERTLRFGLVFVLCRSESLRLRVARRQLREILRDVRDRMAAGGAVIGVIMKTDGVMCEDAGEDSAVSALLAMLHSVFPLKSRGRLCSEVRSGVLIPSREETRRELQRLACEALTAADELRRLKPRKKSSCFSWRRRKWKDGKEKEFLQEQTALTILQHPNGDCAETTDA